MASSSGGASDPSASLAPVTYLFGAGPSGAPVPSVAEPSPSTARERRRAENVSLHGLTRRNMSRWEVQRLLASRELDDDVIADEIARLEGVGLIDDVALAETLVRTQRERKGLGRQALVAELKRRHIDPSIIEAAVDDGSDADSEQQRATELAVKRARALSSYDHETAKRRLTGFLLRKGYSSSVVQAAIVTALGGRTSGVQFR